MGHAAGDALLQVAAERLLQCARASDTNAIRAILGEVGAGAASVSPRRVFGRK
nr:GGDEF domain-containing protein [Candidatus Thiodictyon syntrophicum]